MGNLKIAYQRFKCEPETGGRGPGPGAAWAFHHGLVSYPGLWEQVTRREIRQSDQHRPGRRFGPVRRLHSDSDLLEHRSGRGDRASHTSGGKPAREPLARGVDSGPGTPESGARKASPARIGDGPARVAGHEFDLAAAGRGRWKSGPGAGRPAPDGGASRIDANSIPDDAVEPVPGFTDVPGSSRHTPLRQPSGSTLDAPSPGYRPRRETADRRPCAHPARAIIRPGATPAWSVTRISHWEAISIQPCRRAWTGSTRLARLAGMTPESRLKPTAKPMAPATSQSG